MRAGLSFQSKHIGAILDCVIAGAVRSVGLFRLFGFVGLLSKPSHEEVSSGFSGQVPQSIV